MHEMKYDWFSENREYLVASIQHVKAHLRNLSTDTGVKTRNEKELETIPKWTQYRTEPAIVTVSQTFHLTQFETDILVFCAGAETDGEISILCSKLSNNHNNKFPTFDIALRAFPQPNWEAILPSSALRRFQLITL